MKHLKVRGQLIEGGTMARVEILSQSHFNNEFGNEVPCNPTMSGWESTNFCMFRKNGYGLISHSFVPAKRYKATNVPLPNGETLESEIWFLVNNKYNKQLPSDSESPGELKIPVEEWPKFKELVNAYNEWGATQ